jgi:putative membrane protein
MLLLLKWLIMAVSIAISTYLIPGVSVSGFLAALWVALFLGIVNILIKPILILITLPINILTLGLFTFVINALLILLASSMIKGFEVSGFWVAVLFSVVLSLINYVLGRLLGTKRGSV